MSRQLPVRPNLEHLKAQAKDLLDAFRQRDPDAFRRVRERLPSAAGVSDPELAQREVALHDAQSVIAREYGFASWAQLRTSVQEQVGAAEQPGQAALRALMQTHVPTPLPSEVERVWLDAVALPAPPLTALAPRLPLLSLRNALLTPGSVVPLVVGRELSLAAVHAAANATRELVVFSQQHETDNDLDQIALHEVGCQVLLLHVSAPQAGMVWIVVRAQRWVRLEAIEQRAPYLSARVSEFVVQDAGHERLHALEQALRAGVQHALTSVPQGETFSARVEQMSVSELADATIANLPCSVADKASYAAEPSLVVRVERALALLTGTRP